LDTPIADPDVGIAACKKQVEACGFGSGAIGPVELEVELLGVFAEDDAET
jgi:hypothetical protein